MRRFAVAVSDMNTQQQEVWRELIRERGLSWWHWIGDLWLIIDKNDEYTCADMRDLVKSVTSRGRCIVFDVPEGGTWAGFGPKVPKPMFGWIRGPWSGGDDD